jgi:hypothetical protein
LGSSLRHWEVDEEVGKLMVVMEVLAVAVVLVVAVAVPVAAVLVL